MSESQDTKQLTIDDPVAPEIVEKLQQLRNAKLQLSEQYVDLEMEKIKYQVAIRQVEAERDKVFNHELQARGMGVDTPVEIDSKTRKFIVLTTPKS